MPPAPELYTVFDTNVYRGLSLDALDALRSCEAAAGIEPLASLWPCLELLAHSGSPTDPAYGRARAALFKVSRHAGYEGQDGLRLRMHEDGESSLARGLFSQMYEDRLLEHGFVAGLIRKALAGEPTDFLRENQESLDAIAARVAAEEQGFARSFDSLRDWAPDHRQPALDLLRSDDGLRLIAKTRITTLASRMDVPIQGSELGSQVDQLLVAYRIAMHFLRDLLVDALTSDMDFSNDRNRNSVWDLKIAFHAATGAAVQGVPVLLVTTTRASDEQRAQPVYLTGSRRWRNTGSCFCVTAA